MREDPTPERLVRWRDHVHEEALRLYAEQGMIQALAEEYFDGAKPLFPEAATDVADQISQMERVLGWFNDGLLVGPPHRSKRAAACASPLNAAELRAAAAPAIQEEMALVVDLAKAEAWNLIGEWRKGLTQLGPHVWQDGSRAELPR